MPVSTAPDLTSVVRTPAPGAASTAVAQLVGGPRLAGEAVASTRDLLAVAVGTDLVCVTGPDAVRLPCAVVTAVPPPRVRVGTPVTVGDGSIRVRDGAGVTVVRWWRPQPARIADLGLAATRAAEETQPDVDAAVAGGAGRLAAALSGAGDVGAAVCGLLGLGPGLTPAGDDVLAGALVALAAARRDAADAADMADALDGAVRATRPFERTTAVSAGLLAHARRGLGIPQLTSLVRALGRPDADVDAAARALLRVGHTSGAALHLGVLLALAPARWAS
ncbi:DUF2877 domain-containing protein [Jiangella gansuensis]|uniref:oxamate carbamoyltransferase subunit AllH family protein n=1 Tax=Jiangella gansuensis TaxID=281473 RepID=UPI0004BCC0CD|nr:DUF2877 domain-containing protein [Jiangella gansuensis]